MYRLLVLCLLLSLNPAEGQELPPIKNFSPIEVNAESQNWGISQSNSRLIYVANNSGLLEYNGASWRLFPSPNETILRSVHVVEDLIYTGCYREFGYWTKNSFGSLDYISLSQEIEDTLLEDEEFWSITYVEGKVFFQSKKRIYIYEIETKQIEYIENVTSLPRIFNNKLGVFVQGENGGLFQITAGKKLLVTTNDLFENDEIINIFSNDNDLVLITANKGFYTISEEKADKWRIPADNILKSNRVYSAIRLEDNRYALGTVSNGLFTLNTDGSFQMGIDQTNGLRNNTVLSLHEDFDGSVWAGLDNGLSIINLYSPFSVFNDIKGEIGSVYSAFQKNGNLYLGTNQGLYVRDISEGEGFELIKGTQGQVWSLDYIEGNLFCGHHSGTFLISGKKAKKIIDVPGTWKVMQFSKNKELLLQGNYDGLYLLEGQNETWRLRNKIEGFNNSSRYFEVLENEVFVNHEYRGVFKIQVDSSFSKALEINIDSLVPGFKSSIVKFNEAVFYAHKSGVLRYHPKEDRFITDSTLSKIYTDNTYVSGKMIVTKLSDELWFFTKDGLANAFRGKLDEDFVFDLIPIDKKVRATIDGYESIIELEENQYLIGTSIGYIIVDISKMADAEVEVNIQSVNQMSKKQSGNLGRALGLGQDSKLKPGENSLRFTFYSTSYDIFKEPKYQFQLTEVYPEWSEWSEEPSVTFENLPSGNYTFSVRSMVGNSISANTASYSFSIERPWYLSNMAWMFYTLAFISGAFLIHGSYRKFYRKRQEKLIARNQREMQLAKAKSEREIIKIKNEQLQKEFRSKSNELAASTLSIIRKNELLNRVKDELKSKNNNGDLTKSIIEIIDEDLRNNDDWELFKEAFNNADRKFLKKLKKAHPKLTPNDIRLCAYLRLNLSSKEIAPLFNISPRSVEIKRYRLRKKMNLSHDDNLTDYILKF